MNLLDHPFIRWTNVVPAGFDVVPGCPTTIPKVRMPFPLNRLWCIGDADLFRDLLKDGWMAEEIAAFLTDERGIDYTRTDVMQFCDHNRIKVTF
jgi:hypothetical protein